MPRQRAVGVSGSPADVVVDHLKGSMGFTDRVFHMETSDRFMWGEFLRIQQQAGFICHATENTSTPTPATPMGSTI